jgi:hypothetical protein
MLSRFIQRLAQFSHKVAGLRFDPIPRRAGLALPHIEEFLSQVGNIRAEF